MTKIGIAVRGDGRGGEPLSGLRDTLDWVAEIGFSHAELGAKTLFVSIGDRLQPQRLAALRAVLDGAPVR